MKTWILRPLLLLTATLCLNSMLGCSEIPDNVVYMRMGKAPEETQGTMRIATNRKIPVSYGDNQLTEMDLGGKVVIDENDLAFLLRFYRDNRSTASSR